MAGEFYFTVSDGVSTDRQRTFIITARHLQLEMRHKRTLQVFPGCLQPIRREHLFATTNDDQYSSLISFNVLTAPLHGRLMSTNSMFTVTSFTQEDVDRGRISYQHNGGMEGTEEHDSFIFEVSALYAGSIQYEHFKITTSFELINADNIAQLISMASNSVEEGGELTLTRNNLDPDMMLRKLYESNLDRPLVTYVFKELPRHGIVTLRDVTVTGGTNFTQSDIDEGVLVYKHDDSEAKSDKFLFRVCVHYTHETGREAVIMSKMSVPLNISIRSVNDIKFDIRTQYPGMELVQGSTGVITRNHLRTIDRDTPPSQIVYTIADGPSHGRLVFADDLDTPRLTFTQQDIDDDRVLFVQDGGEAPGGFFFSVTDGKHDATYVTFNVRVLKLELQLSKVGQLVLVQGDVARPIDASLLPVQTNGNINDVIFNITDPPMRGSIFVGDSLVFTFTYEEIAAGDVMYVQTDMNYFSDTFEMSVSDRFNVLLSKRMNIAVKPRLKNSGTERMLLRPGESRLISTIYLDASQLAEMTHSVPVYKIETPPEFGDVVKLRSTAGARRKRNVDFDNAYVVLNFTHDDVANDVIGFRARSAVTHHDKTDSFSYRLHADGVQPAGGMFYVTVAASHKTTTTTTSLAPSTPKAASPPEVPTTEIAAKSAGTEQKMLIIIIVVVITCLFLLLFIIYQCCKRRRDNARKRRQRMIDAQERKSLRMTHDHDDPQRTNNVYIDPYRRRAPITHQESVSSHSGYHHHPVPVIITSDTEDADRSRSNSIGSGRNSLARAQHSHAPPRHVQHSSLDQSDYGTGSPHNSPDLDRNLGSRSLDSPASDATRAVPTCKVTPLCDSDESLHVTSSSKTLPQRGSATPNSADWKTVDPEMMQHYRKSNPVLHKTKHWV